MPYIIDGHNLIPKIHGLSLTDIDDEMQLVELLQEFCHRRRKKVEVYFDNGPPGQPRAHTFGAVVARFVRQGLTADEAIRARLARLGRSARNWTVVSSDRSVQASARAVRASVLSSGAFAELMSQASGISSQESAGDEAEPLSSDEVKRWLEIFGENETD